MLQTTLREALRGTDALDYIEREIINNRFLNLPVTTSVTTREGAPALSGIAGEYFSRKTKETLMAFRNRAEEKYPDSGFKRWFAEKYGLLKPVILPDQGKVNVDDAFLSTLQSYDALVNSVSDMTSSVVGTLLDEILNGHPWKRSSEEITSFENIESVMDAEYESRVRPALEEFALDLVDFSNVMVAYINRAKRFSGRNFVEKHTVEKLIRKYANEFSKTESFSNLEKLASDGGQILRHFLDFTDAVFGLPPSGKQGSESRDYGRRYRPAAFSVEDMVAQGVNEFNLKEKIYGAMRLDEVKKAINEFKSKKTAAKYFAKYVAKTARRSPEEYNFLDIASNLITQFEKDLSPVISFIETDVKRIIAEYIRRRNLSPEEREKAEEEQPFLYFRRQNVYSFEELRSRFTKRIDVVGYCFGDILRKVEDTKVFGIPVGKKALQNTAGGILDRYIPEPMFLGKDLKNLSDKILRTYAKIVYDWK
ncbi:hypothetical protein D6764_04835 [Candidatus Woesearchaeota archaeon]|nr:MAG: hypothetical protein D6764_04835 [Candidatus Woesearchaeota archaeon]